MSDTISTTYGSSLVVNTEPAKEPVTFADIQAQCRIDDTDEQTYVEALIVACRRYAEAFTRRRFITTALELRAPAFLLEFRLPDPPLQTVERIQYTDTAGALQTVDSGDYQVDANSEPGRVRPVSGGAWPSEIATDTYGAVLISYNAGYGDDAADVPQGIRDAISLLVANRFEHREPVVLGTTAAAVPLTVETLLWQYRFLEVL